MACSTYSYAMRVMDEAMVLALATVKINEENAFKEKLKELK